MNDLYKDNINIKIKELERLQKQALDKLAKYQTENPTNKEKLQKQNEFSINLLNSYTKEDPRFIRTQQAYDTKEKFTIIIKIYMKLTSQEKSLMIITINVYIKCQY